MAVIIILVGQSVTPSKYAKYRLINNTIHVAALLSEILKC